MKTVSRKLKKTPKDYLHNENSITEMIRIKTNEGIILRMKDHHCQLCFLQS